MSPKTFQITTPKPEQSIPHKKRLGRPQIWPTQIAAPREALELYALIASLQDSDAFESCHIWSGAKNGVKPVIKWRSKNKGVVGVLAGYIGTPMSKRLCGTENCVNPFHFLPYAAPEGQLLPTPMQPIREPSHEINLDDYIELVQDVIDRQALRKTEINFKTVRGLMSPEDITDTYLRDALNQMGYRL